MGCCVWVQIETGSGSCDDPDALFVEVWESTGRRWRDGSGILYVGIVGEEEAACCEFDEGYSERPEVGFDGVFGALYTFRLLGYGKALSE